ATKMKFFILAVAATVALAAPQAGYQLPQPDPQPQPTYGVPDASVKSAAPVEVVPIIKDQRTQNEDGTYTVDFEAGNGIVVAQSGSPSGPEGAVVSSGQYTYKAPDGTNIAVKYVADENGYQPQSDSLPVAPIFPHPLPQYVLDQIEFAAKEDAALAAAEAAERSAAPSQTYAQPL
ncbi:hypothetical protein OTU49_003084, partial [Cherax quadricarinatus]